MPIYTFILLGCCCAAVWCCAVQTEMWTARRIVNALLFFVLNSFSLSLFSFFLILLILSEGGALQCTSSFQSHRQIAALTPPAYIFLRHVPTYKCTSNMGPSFNHVFRLLNSLIWLYTVKKGEKPCRWNPILYIYSNSLEKEMLLLLLIHRQSLFLFFIGNERSFNSASPAWCCSIQHVLQPFAFSIYRRLVYLMESAFLRCTFSLFARLQVSLHKPFACRVVD